jgi:alkyl hydroperoxide reductase subunit AhpC
MVFSFNRAFEPTTTTEMGAVAHLEKQFRARNCNVIGIGLESRERLRTWKVEIDKVYACDCKFAVINDTDGTCLRQLCMLDRPERFAPPHGPEGVLRANSVVLLIDPFKKCRFRSDYPVRVGRNFYEILRALDSLQLKDYRIVSTPCNWEQGDALLVPPTTPESQIPVLYPLGVNKERPYLWSTNFEDEDDGDDSD